LRKEGISVADNTPTLRRGNKGEAVEELQALLNAKFGFALEIDGNFCRATETAVKEFQKRNGLTSDGIVGKKTWAALGVKDINVPDSNAGNISPPDDNGNNENPPTICMPYADFQAMRAAVVTAYGILKKYEGELI
jgi:peptidoglycan hydrolase-like protein with peptidoglycan-binding domain